MTIEQDFWSRRREGVAAEAAEDETAREAELQAAADADLEEKSDEEILAELHLPVPESLGQGDDFTAFMAKAVPNRIRQRALRVLWRSNPVLANVDQLVDYGGDFTDKATVVENMQTAYQVGKGMLRHIEALAAQVEEKTEDQAALAESPQDSVISDDEAPEVENETLVAYEEVEAEAYDPPKPRRMRFTVEETA